MNAKYLQIIIVFVTPTNFYFQFLYMTFNRLYLLQNKKHFFVKFYNRHFLFYFTIMFFLFVLDNISRFQPLSIISDFINNDIFKNEE